MLQKFHIIVVVEVVIEVINKQNLHPIMAYAVPFCSEFDGLEVPIMLPMVKQWP